MSIALIREHYDYHHWANRRLFDLASGLGEGVTRDMGAHWSFPTLKGMFAHIYGADNVWLTRWKGSSPSRLSGDAVAAGDPVIVLESMKMEIPVEAPRAGTVREIKVAEGQTVQEGDTVAVLD